MQAAIVDQKDGFEVTVTEPLWYQKLDLALEERSNLWRAKGTMNNQLSL